MTNHEPTEGALAWFLIYSVKMPIPPQILEPAGPSEPIFNFLNPHTAKPQVEPPKWKKQPITSLKFVREITPPSLIMTTPVSVCILPLQKHPSCSHIELKDNIRMHWSCRFNWANEIIDDYTRVWNIAKSLGGLQGISHDQEEFVAKRLCEISGLGRFHQLSNHNGQNLGHPQAKTRAMMAALGGYQTGAAVYKSGILSPFALHESFSKSNSGFGQKSKQLDFVNNIKKRARASSKFSDSIEKKLGNPMMNRMDSLIYPVHDANSIAYRQEFSLVKGSLKDKTENSLRLTAIPTSITQLKSTLAKKIEEKMLEFNKELALNAAAAAAAAAAKRSIQLAEQDSAIKVTGSRLNRKFKAVSNVLKMTHLLSRPQAPKEAAPGPNPDSSYTKQSSLRNPSNKPALIESNASLKRSFTTKLEDQAQEGPNVESPSLKQTASEQPHLASEPTHRNPIEARQQPHSKPTAARSQSPLRPPNTHRQPGKQVGPTGAKHSRQSSLNPSARLLDASDRAEQQMMSFLVSLRQKQSPANYVLGGAGRAFINKPSPMGTPRSRHLLSDSSSLPPVGTAALRPRADQPLNSSTAALLDQKDCPAEEVLKKTIEANKLAVSFSSSARVVFGSSKALVSGSLVSVQKHRSTNSHF